MSEVVSDDGLGSRSYGVDALTGKVLEKKNVIRIRQMGYAAMPGSHTYSKLPEVTFGFWIIKILATTLGETFGDTVTMTWLEADVMANSGYLVGSAIFLALLVVLVIAQIVARKFHPFLYWATIAASTTFGTTLADFADRSLGIGYTGGSLLLFTCLMVVLAIWYWSEGTIS
jgi:uncharacterized membrane-anchored protein